MTIEQKPEIRVHIRHMIWRDIPQVLQIEQENSKNPWTEEKFNNAVKQKSNLFSIVAEYENKVVGFLVCDPESTKIHLLNFAVAKDLQRQGIGNQMMAKLIDKLSTQHRNKIALEVRETNLDAQLFLRDCGFRAVNTFHSYFDDTKEDAYVMHYRYREPETPTWGERTGSSHNDTHKNREPGSRAR